MIDRHVYIIGSKGIPAMYGGFETFVEKLTENKNDSKIFYHVACMDENSKKSNIFDEFFEHNDAYCYNVKVPSIGPSKAIYYDLVSLKKAIDHAVKNRVKNPIFYILACRIGPFANYFKKKIVKIGGKLLVNPDGHEWMREKWSMPIRKYWKYSEKLMVKNADLLVCDSKNIKKYIQNEYKAYSPRTCYIAYGTDLALSKYKKKSEKVVEWFNKKNIKEDNYYLIVGRFVPENNYESMIKEFMKSKSKRDLVLITNYENSKFYKTLNRKINFVEDKRIKFVGTVYDQELLKYIRQNAYAYIHGHEVGGTNPSLLEALNSTKLNLLLNVGFNKEVGRNGAIYWNKNNLATVINSVNQMDKTVIDDYDMRSKSIIYSQYSWGKIVAEYQELFKSL